MTYSSSFSKPLGDFDLSPKGQDFSGVDYFRFNGEEWSAPDARRRKDYLPQQPNLEIFDDSEESKYEFAEDDLKHAKSTAARLTALEKIAASGVEKFSFEDKDGNEREFRVETNKCGNKTLIQCYGMDSNGHEQVVMRMARNESGELEQQRNKDGKPVSYYGDNWSRTMQGKSLLVGENRTAHNSDDARSSKLKNQDRKESRDREHDRDREHGKSRGGDREQSRDTERDGRQRSRARESTEICEEKRRPRFDFGRALADVAAVAAPFLMAQLSNKNRCNDMYPYRDYPQHLPERGCHNYYDSNNRHPHFSNDRDDERSIFMNLRHNKNNNNNGNRWYSHNRDGHGHNHKPNYRIYNKGICR